LAWWCSIFKTALMRESMNRNSLYPDQN
jgi:hypothetical protein